MNIIFEISFQDSLPSGYYPYNRRRKLLTFQFRGFGFCLLHVTYTQFKMASVAPAVPSADSGMLTQSNQGEPMPVSAEEMMQPARQQEVSLHTGAGVDIETYIRTHFIQVASLAWNTTQQAGTILWSQRIHPANSNEIVRHLSKIFNTWSGGLDYKLKIAATGFNAGAICVFRLPPNIPVEQIQSISQMTHFPHLIIEAKTLEMVTTEFIDQLRHLYHYTQADQTLGDNFGGTFVIAVWSPLVATGSGPSAVNIIVSNKCSENFYFNQIIPPSLAAEAGFNPGLDAAKLYFQGIEEGIFPHYTAVNPTRRMSIRSITTMPNMHQTWCSIGQDREPLRQVPNYYGHCEQWPLFMNGFAGVQVKFWGNAAINNSDWNYYNAGGTVPNISALLHLCIMNGPTLKEITAESTYAGAMSALAPLTGGVATLGYCWWRPGTNNAQDILQHSTLSVPIVPAANESFIMFETPVYRNIAQSNVNLSDPMLWNTYQAIRRQKEPLFAEGEALLIQVRDKVTNLPLFYIKMHYKGYFTAPVTANNIDFDLIDLDFVPVSTVLANAPIPTSIYSNIVTYKMRKSMNM